MRIVLRILLAAVILVVAVVVAYAANVWGGMRATAQTNGTIAGLAVYAPVQILRDQRGIPHIRAANEHDMYFAQGFVEGEDRLFQLDLLRRYVYGELSEVFGSITLAADERSREIPVRQIVAAQWAKADARQRMILTAFAEGVNAAAARESTPVEFRALGYRFQPWRPQDALAVGFSTVISLTDDWNEIAGRVGRNLPLSDPCFDAPVMEGLRGVANPAHCDAKAALTGVMRVLADSRPPIGSNEWAAGADRTTTHRALLANDPHLPLQIPGVWYLVDLKAPRFHAAGATLAGTPGVILGHNDRIAWGATNGSVTSMSVFYAPRDYDWKAVTERIHVRFGKDVARTYLRNGADFAVEVRVRHAVRRVVVRWPAYSDPQSPLAAFDALDRAGSIEAGLAALRTYPGPTQNFVVADTSGRAAYQLAGDVPDDPLWARGIHPVSDLDETYPNVPFDELPEVAPSRSAIVWTSNNKMYGPHYPLRLSPEFEPPCRAFRVATLLKARKRYDVAYFASMQMDVVSPCERGLVAHVPAFARWGGAIAGDSTLATSAVRFRMAAVAAYRGMTQALIAVQRTQRALKVTVHNARPPLPWRVAGAVQVFHPLSSLGFWFLNGTRFPGDGDAYTVHVQHEGFSQSFRAVWDIGNWDAGGITIPQGESGRPGSGHYTDEAAAWMSGRLVPLPFSDRAVMRSAVNRLTLLPSHA